MDYKRYIAERIQADGISAEELEEMLAVPPDSSMGDYLLHYRAQRGRGLGARRAAGQARRAV